MQLIQLLSFVTLAASMALAISLPSQEKRLIPPFTDVIEALPIPKGALAGGGGKLKRSVSAFNHRFVDSLLDWPLAVDCILRLYLPISRNRQADVLEGALAGFGSKDDEELDNVADRAASQGKRLIPEAAEKRLIPPFPEIISSLPTGDGLGALAGGGGKYRRSVFPSHHRFVDFKRCPLTCLLIHISPWDNRQTTDVSDLDGGLGAIAGLAGGAPALKWVLERHSNVAKPWWLTSSLSTSFCRLQTSEHPKASSCRWLRVWNLRGKVS